MPLTASGAKQTPPHGIGVIVGDMLHLPYHAKPVRGRHLLLLVVSILFVGALLLEVATIVTRKSVDPRSLFSQSVTNTQVVKTSMVRSSYGFGFVYSPEQFTASIHQQESGPGLSSDDLDKNAAVAGITLKPLPSVVPANEAATELEVRAETDAASFAAYKNNYQRKTDITAITADYFAPASTNLATITEESRTTESLGGGLVTKTVYVVAPKFAGNTTRTIVWSAQVNAKPVAVTIRGINGDLGVPTTMQPILESIQLSTEANVKGLSVFAKKSQPIIGEAYVADLVSPAVVKIYHTICGSLEFNGSELSNDTCIAKTGSGFIVSSDGYIATNGHVVVYSAKDMLVDALLQNRSLLDKYLAGLGLNAKQTSEVMSRSDLTASAVSKVYDLPDNSLRLRNQRGITIAATGKTALPLSSEADIKNLTTRFDQTSDLRQAAVIGYDYKSADKLSIAAKSSGGFSASDVALLKIDTKDAPYIGLADAVARQNQSVTLFGFPGDADNELIDSSTTDVTVTKGTINSVRDAAGGEGKLYQTDADASRGNSGGPAVNSDGKAIGLLTYRYDSGESGDAAKSYVRDIKDFKDLVNKKDITLNTEGRVQQLWAEGLDLYSKHYYSKALTKFEQVRSLYPSHRLAEQYADMSRQAVSAGKDTEDPSAALLLLLGGLGLGGMLAGGYFIVRHYGRHKLYKFSLQHGHLQVSHS